MDLQDGVSGAEASPGSPMARVTDEPDEERANTPGREGDTPRLTLDGFDGPLAHLLVLARSRQVDLAHLSLAALVGQLVAALQQAAPAIPLGQKADWVVMAAWLVQLRSLLLLPADAPAQQTAAVEADELRASLVTLHAMQSLAGWLAQRPQLGHDVFARGQPEVFGVLVDVAPAIDLIEFLWASLAQFDDAPLTDKIMTIYHPRPLDLHDVAEGRARILRRLGTMPGGTTLDQLLPDLPAVNDPQSDRALRRRSAWSSTFAASLELAKQGDVVLGQAGTWTPIQVTLSHPHRASASQA